MRQKAAENLEELLDTMKHWQGVEEKAMAQCSTIMGKTENPLIRLIMEIVRQDSAMHKRVQQVIIDSLEKEAFTLTPEELGDVWDLIEEHAALEKETIELADKAQRNCRLFIQRFLVDYLVQDEQKHDRLLAQLNDFKRNLYPYG
jgi:hypothetical protein